MRINSNEPILRCSPSHSLHGDDGSDLDTSNTCRRKDLGGRWTRRRMFRRSSRCDGMMMRSDGAEENVLEDPEVRNILVEVAMMEIEETWSSESPQGSVISDLTEESDENEKQLDSPANSEDGARHTPMVFSEHHGDEESVEAKLVPPSHVVRFIDPVVDSVKQVPRVSQSKKANLFYTQADFTRFRIETRYANAIARYSKAAAAHGLPWLQ